MEFTPITGTALQGIAKAVGHAVGNAEIGPLSFYTRGDLLLVDGQRYIAAGDGPVTDGQLYPLTGHGSAIHEANKIAGLSITDDTVIDYLAFFNLNIRDDDGGNFIVLLEDKKVGDRMVTRPRAEKKPDHYMIECNVMHDDQLWSCQYKVTPDGVVEMVSSDLLEEADLPRVH